MLISSLDKEVSYYFSFQTRCKYAIRGYQFMSSSEEDQTLLNMASSVRTSQRREFNYLISWRRSLKFLPNTALVIPLNSSIGTSISSVSPMSPTSLRCISFNFLQTSFSEFTISPSKCPFLILPRFLPDHRYPRGSCLKYPF